MVSHEDTTPQPIDLPQIFFIPKGMEISPLEFLQANKLMKSAHPKKTRGVFQIITDPVIYRMYLILIQSHI